MASQIMETTPNRPQRNPQRELVTTRIPSALLLRRNSWFLKMDDLLTATTRPRCYAIIVLGTPSYNDLTPLLLSGHYAHSLVVIATHQPPDIPHIIIPALRILRLSTPMTADKSCAPQLVRVLGWAERLAHDWRKFGGSGILELTEEDFLSSTSHTASDREPRSTSTTTSSTKHPFDVLINFLPSNVPDNFLLKQAILTTAVSRPYLTPTSSVQTLYGELLTRCKSALGSVRGKSIISARSLPRTHLEGLFSPRSSILIRNTQTPTMPHLIHLIPRSTAQYPQSSMKLIDSMEAFLSAFGCSVDIDAMPSRAAVTPKPYIMYSSTFAAALDCALSKPTVETAEKQSGDGWGCEWTVADIVLSGSLDGAVSMTGGIINKAGEGPAWISGPEDIVLVPASGHIPISLVSGPTARPLSAHPLSTLRETVKASPTTVNNRVSGQVFSTEPLHRPDTPHSAYSVSSDISLIASPPPSFHAHDNPPAVIEETTPVDQIAPPVATEEAQDALEKPKFTQSVLPRRLSLKKMKNTLVVGLKDVSAWRYGAKT